MIDQSLSFHKCCRKIPATPQHSLIPNPKCTSYQQFEDDHHKPVPIDKFLKDFNKFQEGEKMGDSILQCKNLLKDIKDMLDQLFTDEYLQILQVENQINKFNVQNPSDWYSYITTFSEFTTYNGDEVEFDDEKYEQANKNQRKLMQSVLEKCTQIGSNFGLNKEEEKTTEKNANSPQKSEKTSTSKQQPEQKNTQQQQFAVPPQMMMGMGMPGNAQYMMQVPQGNGHQFMMPPPGMQYGMQPMFQQVQIPQQQKVKKTKKKVKKTDADGTTISVDEEKSSDTVQIQGISSSSKKIQKSKSDTKNVKIEQGQLIQTQNDISDSNNTNNLSDPNALIIPQNIKIEHNHNQIPQIQMPQMLQPQVQAQPQLPPLKTVNDVQIKDDNRKKHYSSDDWHKILLFYVKHGMNMEITMKTFNVSKKNLQRQKNNFLKKQKQRVSSKNGEGNDDKNDQNLEGKKDDLNSSNNKTNNSFDQFENDTEEFSSDSSSDSFDQEDKNKINNNNSSINNNSNEKPQNIQQNQQIESTEQEKSIEQGQQNVIIEENNEDEEDDTDNSAGDF